LYRISCFQQLGDGELATILGPGDYLTVWEIVLDGLQVDLMPVPYLVGVVVSVGL
jgi:hypothetical protein